MKECPWCGGDHQPARCRKVKSIEYDGVMIRRVKFFSPAELQYDSPHEVTAEPLLGVQLKRAGLAT